MPLKQTQTSPLFLFLIISFFNLVSSLIFSLNKLSFQSFISKKGEKADQKLYQWNREFLGLAKVRLSKFRGMNKDTFYLHLKECEFRFNHRKENLYKLILKLVKNKALKIS